MRGQERPKTRIYAETSMIRPGDAIRDDPALLEERSELGNLWRQVLVLPRGPVARFWTKSFWYDDPDRREQRLGEGWISVVVFRPGPRRPEVAVTEQIVLLEQLQ